MRPKVCADARGRDMSAGDCRRVAGGSGVGGDTSVSPTQGIAKTPVREVADEPKLIATALVGIPAAARREYVEAVSDVVCNCDA